MKMPERRILRSIVQDAINDRKEISECHRGGCRQADDAVARYGRLLTRLQGVAPMTPEDRDALASACMHARIWREGLVDAWKDTNDKMQKLACRQDLDRVARTEETLGVVRHWTQGGPEPEGMRTITLTELMARTAA